MKKLGVGLLRNLISIVFGSKEDTKKLKKKEVLDVAMRLYDVRVADKIVEAADRAINGNNAPSPSLCDIQECNAIVL